VLDLLQNAVLRVAAWPLESLGPLRSPELTRRVDERARSRRGEVVSLGRRLADELTAVVPGLPTAARHSCLRLRRQAHNGQRVRLSSGQREALGQLPDEARVTWRAYEQAVEAEDRDEETAADDVRRAVARERDGLRALAATADFARASAVANPEVWRRTRLDEVVETSAVIPTKRESTVLWWALRAAGRPTPNGLWAGVAPVSPGEETVATPAPRRARVSWAEPGPRPGGDVGLDRLAAELLDLEADDYLEVVEGLTAHSPTAADAAAPRSRVIVDLRAGVTVTWDACARAVVRTALQELLEMLIADEAAESFRKDITARRMGLEPLPAASPVVRRWPWASGAPAGPAASTLRWEQRLATEHDASAIEVRFDAHASTSPGPGGDHLVGLDGEGRAWVLAGRPQPGMCASWHDPLLAEEAGEPSAYWSELRSAVARWASTGPVPVDVRVEHPWSTHLAERPTVAERWSASRLAEAPCEIDEDGRVWPLDRDARRRLPIYSSAAASVGDLTDLHALAVAFSHGWEYLSFGFPALPRERDEWCHLPRLTSASGAVLSAERWTVPLESVTDLASLPLPELFAGWRGVVRDLPTWVSVCFGTDPTQWNTAIPTDSVLVAASTLTRAARLGVPLVLAELPHGGLASLTLPNGTFRAELAVTWLDRDYGGWSR
jgi:hypothetical protein